MADVPISLTCADYARVMPLATGAVKPEGIALTMILGERGSWPARAEMLRRAVQDPTVQGGEWSMAQYLYRVDKGKRSQVGGKEAPIESDKWHSLRLIASNDKFEVSLDGKELFTVTDRSLPQPGAMGVWSQADSITRFGSLLVGPVMR